jgi:hypothetical protein
LLGKQNNAQAKLGKSANIIAVDGADLFKSVNLRRKCDAKAMQDDY